jgi:hypothetical protein
MRWRAEVALAMAFAFHDPQFAASGFVAFLNMMCFFIMRFVCMAHVEILSFNASTPQNKNNKQQFNQSSVIRHLQHTHITSAHHSLPPCTTQCIQLFIQSCSSHLKLALQPQQMMQLSSPGLV